MAEAFITTLRLSYLFMFSSSSLSETAMEGSFPDYSPPTPLLPLAVTKACRKKVLTTSILSHVQDLKLRQIVTMGSQDTLEEKTVTVCCGSDFVNVTFVNFCCTRKDIAQVSSICCSGWIINYHSIGVVSSVPFDNFLSLRRRLASLERDRQGE